MIDPTCRFSMRRLPIHFVRQRFMAASEDQIAEIECRFGVRLPDDYRRFLLTRGSMSEFLPPANSYVQMVPSLQITANCFGAKRHRAVDPRGDRRWSVALDIAAKSRRNFQCRLDVTASESLVEIDIIDERRSDILTLGSHPSPRARNVGGVTACGGTMVRHYFHRGRQRDRLAAVQKIQWRSARTKGGWDEKNLDADG